MWSDFQIFFYFSTFHFSNDYKNVWSHMDFSCLKFWDTLITWHSWILVGKLWSLSYLKWRRNAIEVIRAQWEIDWIIIALGISKRKMAMQINFEIKYAINVTLFFVCCQLQQGQKLRTFWITYFWVSSNVSFFYHNNNLIPS